MRKMLAQSKATSVRLPVAGDGESPTPSRSGQRPSPTRGIGLWKGSKAVAYRWLPCSLLYRGSMGGRLSKVDDWQSAVHFTGDGTLHDVARDNFKRPSGLCMLRLRPLHCWKL